MWVCRVYTVVLCSYISRASKLPSELPAQYLDINVPRVQAIEKKLKYEIHS